jgi:hypothetical protein
MCNKLCLISFHTEKINIKFLSHMFSLFILKSYFIYFEMEADEERLVASTRQIYRLYHNNVSLEKAFILARSRNISADFVESIYNKLSSEFYECMDRFHYYTINIDFTNYSDIRIDNWTSRYLLVYNKTSSDSAFHDMTIIDLFNDKSV